MLPDLDPPVSGQQHKEGYGDKTLESGDLPGGETFVFSRLQLHARCAGAARANRLTPPVALNLPGAIHGHFRPTRVPAGAWPRTFTH